MQGAQAAQGQEAVERCTRDADAITPPFHLVGQFRGRRNHCAADDVAVTIEILGRGMHDEVCTQ
jgi:hypothetical protein